VLTFFFFQRISRLDDCDELPFLKIVTREDEKRALGREATVLLELCFVCSLCCIISISRSEIGIEFHRRAGIDRF
jgi:hypothetical protein